MAKINIGNEDVLNANFVEPWMNKVSKSMKPDNSQKPTISCFVLKMADVKDKNFLWRVYYEYEEIWEILNVWKMQTWSFQLRKLAPNWHFCPWGPYLCPPKSIITAQIHVKFILTHIILAKVLQQPILMVPMDYGL